MKSRKEIAELAAVLAERAAVTGKFNRAWIAGDTLLIARIAVAANTKACALCNGDIEQDKFDKAKERLYKHLEPLAAQYAVRFEIGGDPRGYVLKMFANDGTAPISGNTWGGDESGYGI